MAFSVFWRYNSNEGTRVLAGHPGAYSDTSDDAVAQGRVILQAVQAEPVTPLCVVQTNGDSEEAIYTCEEVYLGQDGEDELFFDVTGLPYWSDQKWWPTA